MASRWCFPVALMLINDAPVFGFFTNLFLVTKLFLMLGKSGFLAEPKLASFEPADVRHLACMEVFVLNLVYFLSESFWAVPALEILKI